MILRFPYKEEMQYGFQWQVRLKAKTKVRSLEEQFLQIITIRVINVQNILKFNFLTKGNPQIGNVIELDPFISFKDNFNYSQKKPVELLKDKDTVKTMASLVFG